MAEPDGRGARAALTAARTRFRALLSHPATPPLAIALITLAAFTPALWNGFVWDDDVNILDNPHFRGLGWREIRWMLTTDLMGHWIPVTWLTFGLDHAVWGMNPAGYHLTNLLLHAANAAVFYLVALRLLGAAAPATGEIGLRLGATAAALLFALHPQRAESVAWVTERRDVLSGLFFLLTLLTYLEAAGAGGRRRLRWLGVSVGCYALALLSKSIVMTLPLVLIVLDVYPLRRLTGCWSPWTSSAARSLWAEKIPYGVLAVAGAGVAFYTVHVKTPLALYSPLDRIGLTAYGLGFYLWTTVSPLGISPLYERPAHVSLLAPKFFVAVLAAAALTAAAWLLRRRWPAGLAAWLAYGIMLAPVSGLVHAGPQLVASRYSYLSCLGFAVLAGAGVSWLASSPAVTPSLRSFAALSVCAWVLGLATLTWTQVQVWRDSETYWRYALAVDPDCGFCHGNLGVRLLGQEAPGAAAAHLERALALRPEYVGLRAYAGLALLRIGRTSAAIRHFRLALARYRDDSDVRNYLGLALMREGRPEEAVSYLEQAIGLDPGHADALANLGIALAALDRRTEAIPVLRRAIALTPEDARLRETLTRILAGR